MATVGLAFHRDIVTALSLWIDFPTYNYCFLIVPISVYLIWQQRLALAELLPARSSAGIVLSLACLALWWMANAALVGELRQLALVGLLQGIVWAILGGQVYRRLRFPLLYLFLMVPTGTVLLPSLQLVATRLATFLLRLSSVPVFTEGVVIEVPTGTYTVAPGCAGLNFLLVAVALSLLYARYTYGRTGKRIACVGAALTIAILANGARIFGIIWLAEISHRHIDIISDHLLYGWAFFSLIILASMAVGNLFADPPAAPAAAAAIDAPPAEANSRTSVAAALAIIAAVGVVAGQSALTATPPPANAEIALNLPNALGGWRKATPDARWHPSFAEADLELRAAYGKDGRQVEVFVAYYWPQREGHKATAGNNAFAGPAEGIAIDDGAVNAAAGTTRLDISTLRIEGPQGRRLVGYWYWIGGRQTAKPLPARLFALPAHLAGDDRAAVVALAVDGTVDMAGAQASLSDFLLNKDALAEALDAASPKVRALSSTLR